MISLITTCPTGDGTVPPYTGEMAARRAGDRLVMEVHTDQAERVGAGLQGHCYDPTGNTIPRHWILYPVEPDGLDRKGRGALTIAVSLLITVELIAKGTLLTPWLVKAARRELCIVAIQSSSPPGLAGSWTSRP